VFKTDLTKLVVNTIVASKTAQITKQQIAAHTSHEEDDITVIVGGTLVGGIVVAQTEPYTNAMIDKTAAWIKTKKDARNNK
jgi:hypothetical protein